MAHLKVCPFKDLISGAKGAAVQGVAVSDAEGAAVQGVAVSDAEGVAVQGLRVRGADGAPFKECGYDALKVRSFENLNG
jgi:hypothetical protein